MSEHQRIYAQIDLKAVESNLENIRSGLQNETKIMAVVKTDGYGHGSVPIARRLQDKEFMYGFGVATIEEAVELKKQGKTILLASHSVEDIRQLCDATYELEHGRIV